MSQSLMVSLCVGVVRGLLFEGHLLTYNPTYNVVEWVHMCETVSDLSPMEDSSARELSNITFLDAPEDVSQMVSQMCQACIRASCRSTRRRGRVG